MVYNRRVKRFEHINLFVEEIWRWFASHKRVLPWRDLKRSVAHEDQRAYMVLVSEIMLQQTQVARVEIVFRRFLRQFPTIHDLASASNRQVLVAWRGMGYNSRALRLRDAAREIVTGLRGAFPRTMDALTSIRGIGSYTAAAIRNFAFDVPTPCLDTNIRRILHRTFIGPENPDGTWKKDDKYLLKLAGEVLNAAIVFKLSQRKRASERAGLAGPARVGHQKGKGWFTEGKPLGLPSVPSDWHAALMDFGALVCTKRNPKWHLCPLAREGLMKAAYRVKNSASGLSARRELGTSRREPGRMVGARFTPNRIFRGRIIELLRDSHSGLSFADIGRNICADWSAAHHREWLRSILAKLKEEALVTEKRRRFALRD